jgi:HSP20 family molecular chaperone IbpA
MNASPTSNPYRFSGYDFLAFSHAQVFHQSHSGVQTERHPAPDARREREYVSPEVNIFETKEGYVLEAEMPGVNKEGLEITLEGNEITIVGHRKNEVVKGNPLFRERGLADYRRVFERKFQ